MSDKQKHGWNGEQWKFEHEPASRTDIVFEVQDSELQYLVAELFGSPDDRLRHARLIASAPALVSALEDAVHRVRWLMQFVPDTSAIDNELARWDAALRLARGEATNDEARR